MNDFVLDEKKIDGFYLIDNNENISQRKDQLHN